MPDVGNDTKSIIGFMFRAGQFVPNVFKLIKNAMEMHIIGQGGEVSMQQLKKFTNANINEFEFNKRSEDDYKIFEECLKEFGVVYNIKKSPVLNEDRTRDYFIYFGASDSIIIDRCFKEYCKRMEAREEQDLNSFVNKAKKQANEKSHNQDLGKEQKHRNKNKDMNFEI